MSAAQQVLGNKRIRGPKLAVFIKATNGVPMEEALRRADEAGLVIASNRRFSEESLWRHQNIGEGVWYTGTMTAYDLKASKLGKIIEKTDSMTGLRYVFPVPDEHQGKKNIILVAEHPNFTLVKDGNDRIIQATEVDVVENFATNMGVYTKDSKYHLPHGEGNFNGDGLDPESSIRFSGGVRGVGLAIREHAKAILLGTSPSAGLGVIVEVPDKALVPGGVSLEELKVLVAVIASTQPSTAEVEALLRTVDQETLEATRRLLGIGMK